jgi:hypothetical protein
MRSIGIAAPLEIGQVLAVNHAVVERVFHVAAIDIIKKASDVLGALDGARLARRIVGVDDGHYCIGGVKRLQALGIAGFDGLADPRNGGRVLTLGYSLISVDLSMCGTARMRGLTGTT